MDQPRHAGSARPVHQSELLFNAYGRVGATATLTLAPQAGHTDNYLASADESRGRIVKTTSGGKTTTGTEPAPTYDNVLAFLESNLR